ncbi:MAG: cyclic nucleotide-binding domain-containing protein [Bacteroidetes bacterium]|jgi:CRP-like cAMP-binding protein|nr:cyclic nucleotide-binding domain-containing protein [Bacteroidota bacterium]
MTNGKTTSGAVWKNIFSQRVAREGSVEEILTKVPAFADLSARELKEVAAIIHRREYRSGEPVFYQGDPGLGMYIIQDGEVSIQIATKEGERRELIVLTDGDFFGELALLDESPRSADAFCKTDCLLLGFFRPDLFELIERKQELGIKILLKLAEIVAERLRKTDKELSKIKSQFERLQQQTERDSHAKTEEGALPK